MNLLSVNNANATLASGISSGATTIQLSAGSGALFPALASGEYFTLTLNDALTQQIFEICYCTARTSDSLTVLRGQEGTSARAWLIGDYAYNALTAQSFETQMLLQGGNYAVDAGIANAVVAAIEPAPASLSAVLGAPIRVLKSGAANTGAVTLALNGLATAPIVYSDGSSLIAAELTAGALFTVAYNGASFVLQSYSPAQITAEASVRSAEDSSLQTQLNAEAATRSANDAAEATARNAAVNAEGNTRYTADAVEAATRSAEDTSLQTQITSLFSTTNNVTGSRSLGTAYTNSTGRPMFVSVWGVTTGALANLNFICGTVQYSFGQPNTGSDIACNGIVPAGAVYEVVNTVAGVNVSAWVETY